MSDGKRKLTVLGKLSATRKSSDSHGVEAGPDLDQEMEKVFSMDGEKFDLSKISTSPESNLSITKRKSGEIDLNLHRKRSYPHVFPPLKSVHLRNARRVSSPRHSESESGSDVNFPSRKNSRTGTEQDAPQSPTEIPKVIFSDEDGRIESDNEAPLSERAAVPHHDAFDSASSDALRRVQFQIGEIPEDGQVPTGDGTEASEGRKNSSERRGSREKKREELDGEETEKRRRKHRHHHHHHHHHSRYRKYSLQDDLILRKRVGSEVSSSEMTRKNSVQPEEASLLDEVDVENLESRRFDDLRRYKVPLKNSSLSVIRIGRKDGDKMETVVPLGSDKKIIDHSPHEVFVQLDELCGTGDEREWKETARWIKYEEDVEEGADRWGQPHVASLSFHSLLNLRRCLETGVVLLDLEEKDLPGVAYRVVEQMVIEEFIDESDKATVMRALLLRHRHVNEHDRFRFAMKRNFSSYTSLQNLTHDAKPKIVPSLASMDHFSPKTGSKGDEKPANGDSHHHTIDMKEELTYTSSNEDLRRAAKESILRKIPIGAEATTVLVGAVDFLEQPTIAFARLAEGILMPSITEVAIPVRFLFLLLGPPQSDLDYHEIGRSISTLMANDQFHNIAYKATGRKELLSAINEFLDDSIVLPPGDWERKALLPFAELKAKSEAIRKRRNKRLKEAEAEDSQQKALLPSEDGKKPPFDDPLKRTKRPFGGMIRDVKRRFPHYKSDILDGLNLQCLAAAIFMYFAALSGAITFGGLMGDKTHNLIGISETLVATCISGILFALLSGQPLVIVGTTGPLLLFDESLFSFCETNGIDFLGIRVFIGIWLGIIGLVVVCFEGSVFVKMFTRFTEEIFAALISLLYIVESLVKLFSLYVSHPLLSLPEYCSALTPLNSSQENGFGESDLAVVLSNDTAANSTLSGNETMDESRVVPLWIKDEGPVNQPNTALFCTILALGTFFIAHYLRQFRNSKFLGRSARRALGDFGVPIAIVVMVVLDYFVPSTYTEKLQVPEGLEPSKSEVRGWVISPLGVQLWVAFAAAGPALLVYILLFMETHITELIIDKKDRKLKKGSGFHLDIVVLCVLNIGCGFLGAPWMCAATVRSIAHVSAVTVMSRTHAPGDKPHIIDVKEQRMSSLFVAILVGISVLMAPLLRLVPMAVLFGVFLYMGVSSTNGIQFFDRLKLFFMPVKHHSQACYVRRVQTMKMHLFTLIQLLCLVILWVVKSTPISLAFPFFLILMVPLRAQLRYLFTPAELRALDSEEMDGDPNSPEDEPDFYTEAPLPG